MGFCDRVVVSVSTSRSRDGLETYFSNVSVSFRSRQSVGRSRSRSHLELKAKRLGLVSGHNVSFTSGHLNKFFSFFHFHTKQIWAILLCSSSLHHAARQPVTVFSQSGLIMKPAISRLSPSRLAKLVTCSHVNEWHILLVSGLLDFLKNENHLTLRGVHYIVVSCENRGTKIMHIFM